MRFLILFIGVGLVFGFNSGCNQTNKFRHEIAVLDSLQISLDEAVHAYKNWDIDSLVNLRSSMENELNYLSKVMKNSNDTLSRKHALFFGEYKSASKSFKRSENDNTKFLKEIALSNSQLATLKKDLQNGAISDLDTVKIYLHKEKKSVGTLINGLTRIDKIYTVGAEKYKRMNPRVTQILDSLTVRNNN